MKSLSTITAIAISFGLAATVQAATINGHAVPLSSIDLKIKNLGQPSCVTPAKWPSVTKGLVFEAANGDMNTDDAYAGTPFAGLGVYDVFSPTQATPGGPFTPAWQNYYSIPGKSRLRTQLGPFTGDLVIKFAFGSTEIEVSGDDLVAAGIPASGGNVGYYFKRTEPRYYNVSIVAQTVPVSVGGVGFIINYDPKRCVALPTTPQ